MTLTLAATGTIQGVAGSATAITYTIFGDEISTTPTNTFKKLAQGQLPAAAAAIYTVPASTSTIINAISLVNTTAGAVTVVLFADGTAAANRIVNLTVPANGFAAYDANGWKVFDATGQQLFVGATGATGATGSTGPAGSNGTNGTNGWSPTLAVVSNGSSGFVFQIVGWVGGTGTPPSSTNQFIGSSGIVGTAAAAQDIRGPAGAAGASTLAFGIVTGNTGTATADASPDTIAITGANGITTAATDTPDGLVITGSNDFAVVTGNTGTATADVTGDTLAITGSGAISTAATDTPDGLVISAANATFTLPGLLAALEKFKVNSHYYARGDFGIVGDWNVSFDGNCSTGAPTKITSATAAFAAADLGKQITLTGAGVAGAKYVGAITNIDSATQVTVSPSISTNATNQGLNWGTNNDAAWASAQSTINALAYPGVIIEFEKTTTNRYGQAVPVTWTKPVIYQGQGRGYNADTGNYWQVGGTCIAWVAATSDGGTPFAGMTTWVPTGVQNMKGGGYRDIWFDCRNGDQSQALFATKFSSVNGFSLREAFIMDAMAYGLWMDIDATPTEQESTARGMATNLGFRMLDSQAGAVTTPLTTSSAVTLTTTGQALTVTANSLPAAGYGWVMTSSGRPVLFQYTSGGGTTTLSGCRISAEDAIAAPVTVSGSNIVQAVPGNGCAALLSGNASANTNLNDMRMWQISHGTTWGPAALEFANSDSMSFAQIVVNGGNATNDGAINRIRKPGARFNGHVSNLGLACRNNVFYDGDPGAGGVDSMALLNTGVKMTAPAGPNYWWGYQYGNGAGAPTIEAGSYFDWSGNGAFALNGLRSADYTLNVPYTVGVAKTIPGSAILMPPQAIQVNTTFHWRFQMTKSALGAANRLVHIRIGATGTAADAIVQTFTLATTAAADAGIFEVYYTITTANSASSTGSAQMVAMRQLGAGGTGLWTTGNGQTLAGTPTVFTSPVSGLWYISLSVTTGTSEVATTNFCIGEVVRVGSQAA